MGFLFFMFVLLSKSFYIYGVDVPISDSIIRFALYTVTTRAPRQPRVGFAPRLAPKNVPRMFHGITPT
jgi:hypothetical protein